MKYLAPIFLAILFSLLVGCGKPCFQLPKEPVNFWIYPNAVDFINLNYYGGHEYFTGGVSGIVVYRLGEQEFTAFDRSCSFDWTDEDSWIWVEPDGITLKCSKCGTLYNILDGGVIIGPAECPLKQYYTNYDGMRLRVHS